MVDLAFFNPGHSTAPPRSSAPVPRTSRSSLLSVVKVYSWSFTVGPATRAQGELVVASSSMQRYKNQRCSTLSSTARISIVARSRQFPSPLFCHSRSFALPLTIPLFTMAVARTQEAPGQANSAYEFRPDHQHGHIDDNVQRLEKAWQAEKARRDEQIQHTQQTRTGSSNNHLGTGKASRGMYDTTFTKKKPDEVPDNRHNNDHHPTATGRKDGQD